MLKNEFFVVTGIKYTDNNNFSALIDLNSSHPIFKGHFPGSPVVPGVCFIQIIREILEEVFSRKLYVKEVSNIKFMAIANPEIDNILELNYSLEHLSDTEIQAKVNISYNNKTYLSFKGKFDQSF